MKNRSEPTGAVEEELRASIIGLGERSTRKSHYPELRARIAELERAQRALRFLAEAGAAVSRSLDFETTLGNLARVALPELGDVCVVFERGHSGALHQRLAVAHASVRATDGARVLSDVVHTEPIVARLIFRERVEVIADLAAAVRGASPEEAPHFRALREASVASLIVAPYCAGPRSCGALLFATLEGSARRYDELDLSVARQLAQRLAMALENARLYAEAQEASRIKDDFLAIVSHELRTPLTAILGWADMLASRRIGESSLPRAAASIERNARALSASIDDLLDVSRMVANKLDVVLSPIDLVPVVEAAVDAAKPAIAAKRLELDVSIARDLPPILGHCWRLSQVVTNLVTNAIKFTPPGGRVGVELQRRGDRAALVVRDTGCGIRPDFMPHLFERFRQTQGVVDRGRAGLGLGLAIVRHIVELHDGEVHAESEGEGLGAVFTVYLPLARIDAARGPEEPRGCGVTCTACLQDSR